MTVDLFLTPVKHLVVENTIMPSLVSSTYQLTKEIKDWVSYSNELEYNKRTTRDLIPPATYLFDCLNSSRWLMHLENLLDIRPLFPDPELHGAGLHVTDPEGYLQCHLDYAKHPSLDLERRVNLLLFLNPEWKEEWGGAFELWNDDARSVAKRIYPKFNRAVIWEAGDLAYHSAQATTKEAPPRASACCYYLSPPRPNTVRKRALFVPNR